MYNIEILKQQLQPILAKRKVVLYEISWQQIKQDRVLRISIMRDDGTMDIELCTEISRDISELLDDDESNEPYMLEVCSPGAERELHTKEHLINSVGKHVYAKLVNPKAGIDDVTGILLAVDDKTVKIQYLQKTLKKEVIIEMNNLAIIRLAVVMK